MSLEQTFKYWWEHSPPPFNKDYKPHHRECLEQAVFDTNKLEPLPNREARGKALRTRYNQLMKEVE